MTTSHLTAIARKRPSAPMKRLASMGKLVGRVLDYGSGRGFDAQHYYIESFDPYYQPSMPSGEFDTIVCNFVLNVLETIEDKRAILEGIAERLKISGIAYIAVRTDHLNLNGRTSRGTWQDFTTLCLPIVTAGSGFTVYAMKCGEQNCQIGASTNLTAA